MSTMNWTRPVPQPIRYAVRVLRKLGGKYLNLYPTIQLGKRRIKLPLMAGESAGMWNFDLGEPYLLPPLRVMMDMEPGAFVDVGVNVGQTLLKFIMLGDGHSYYGFEPNPAAVEYVKRLIELNDLQEYDLNVISAGLSERASVEKLSLSGRYDSTASTAEGFRAADFHARAEYTAILKGDDAVEALEIDSLSILKVDVEGGELEVLNGLRQTIRTHRPFISCEILPAYDESSEQGSLRRKRTDEVERFLGENAYDVLRLHHDGRVQPLDHIETHGDLDLCEYLFVPSEITSDFHRRLTSLHA